MPTLGLCEATLLPGLAPSLCQPGACEDPSQELHVLPPRGKAGDGKGGRDQEKGSGLCGAGLCPHKADAPQLCP